MQYPKEALDDAKYILEASSSSITPEVMLSDPWICCEQQMVARILTFREGNSEKNGEVWQATKRLKEYFFSTGQLRRNL